MHSSVENVFGIGAGGHARVVISALQEARVHVAGVYDDDPTKLRSEVLRAPVLGTIRELSDAIDGHWVIALGDNMTRRQIAARFPSADWLTVIHPKAYIHESASLGLGTVVFAGAVVQPGARIGQHCIINTGATVDHDCVVGDFCHVGPGCNLGGGVTLAKGVFMGIGSVAIPCTSVGEWTIVGAGAAVVADLPDRVVAVGVPAKVRRKLEI
ncbi:MAG: acetyltransferase [Verrucomicrobiae bacterium]|nr:acetyltransferase [Verrucomicrobiae bacterium]